MEKFSEHSRVKLPDILSPIRVSETCLGFREHYSVPIQSLVSVESSNLAKIYEFQVKSNGIIW